MKGYYKLRKKILEILNSQLPEELYYHSVHHTIDVLKTCNSYIKRQHIVGREAKLLRLGALLHDIGFTEAKDNHEERGKNIAQKLMTSLDFTDSDISIVKGLILATRIPQTPQNELQYILCDADLDYLGRSDFYAISNQLFKELNFGSIQFTKSEWNTYQIRFMEAHKYHSDFALKRRQPNKEKRIAELKK